VTLTTIYWFLAGGVALLTLGGEAVVRGGVMLIRTLGVPPLIVGLFIISLGSASPNLAVSLEAALAGAPDIAVGTVIGANIVNLLLILGLGALITPMASAPKVVLRDGGAMLAAAGVLAWLAHRGAIDRQAGLVLILGFILYAAVTLMTDWRRQSEHSVSCAMSESRSDAPSAAGGLFAVIAGITSLVLGAHFLAGGALALGTALHVSQVLLGLTVVALGACLPVMAVTAIAAIRGHTQIAIGHLIGTSVFNVFGVLGVTALVRPLSVSPLFAAVDVFVMLGAAVLLLPLLAMSWRLTRPKGALLVMSYACYLIFVGWRQGLITPAMIGLG